MNARTITSALITVGLGVTLAMPTTALAERDNRGHRQGHSQHDGNRHRQNRQQHREFKRHNRGHKEHKRHSKRHYKEDRHHAKRHYKKHKRHYKEDRRHAKRHYKGHKRHDGYYNRPHGHRKYGHGYGGGYDYGSNYYYDDDDDEKLLIGLVVGGILGYALNESQQDDGDFYDNSYAPAETARYNNGTCLQEREYQTTVLVGGRKVDAYGTACLQPDGSWKRSLPTVPAY